MAESSQLESQQIIDETSPYTADEQISLQAPLEPSPRSRFFVLCLLLLPISQVHFPPRRVSLQVLGSM